MTRFLQMRASRRWFAALVAVMIASAPALAVEPDEILPDHQLEARARAISSGLHVTRQRHLPVAARNVFAL